MKSLALYLDLSGLSTSCATEALFTGLLRGEKLSIVGNLSSIFDKIGFSIVTFRGERERKKGKEEQTINFFLKILPWLGFY
jgi:hypothetical protein